MDRIHLTEKPGFATLALQSGEPYNLIDDGTLQQIADTLEQLEGKKDCRAVVLWGGKHFAVGANLKELLAKDKSALMEDARRKNWQRIARFSKPLIAAVNGFALGAGHELVLISDIAVAGRSACFGQPEIHLGLIPGAGGTQRLVRVVGKSMAMEMVMAGRQLSAEEALRVGLVSRICEDELTLETAEKIAEKLSRLSPVALKAAKQVLLQGYEKNLSEGMDEEYRAFCDLADSHDREEGIRAFLEKRPPVFKGR